MFGVSEALRQPTVPQVSDYHFLPETGQAAEKVQNCLHESEEVCPHSFILPLAAGTILVVDAANTAGSTRVFLAN